MTASRLLAGLLLVVLTISLIVSPAGAQDPVRPPSQRHASVVEALQNVQRHTLPSVNTEALKAEDARRADEITPYRYGTILDTQLRPDQHGNWERLPSGEWLWRLRIQSREAVSLSVGFTQFNLPDGATLYLYDSEGRIVHGPYTGADATGGQHWTPLVKDDVIVAELTVPADRRSSVDLEIGKVVHGYRSLRPSPKNDGLQKAGACNRDVACEEADPWRKQVRSVGRYTFQAGSTALVCTGALVNNTSGDQTPYFLTAEHCVNRPDVANTMVFYWNYQNDICRPLGSPQNGEQTDAPLDQTSSGATMLSRFGNTHSTGSISGKPDLTLVKIDDRIPPSYQLYFSGWSRRGQPTNASVTIHHPQGHGKRISFDRDPSSFVDYPSTRTCVAPEGDTHFLIENWELGTTEGGSSGAPLFNTNQRIVGVLSGGCAGCDGDADGDDNNQPDWYGRIALGFDDGDYPSEQDPTTFADVLDPLNTGAQSIKGRPLSRDSIPPGPIANFGVQSVTPDSVTLTWQAPGDDDDTGTVDEYLLRYRTNTPIQSRNDFEKARSATNVPIPKPAGSPQSATVAVSQDTSYFFGLVAKDKGGNESPLVTSKRDVTPVSTLKITAPPTPNPTRSQATLRFVTRKTENVRAILYDALGRRIEILMDKEVPPFRRQSVTTDVSSLASGMYFIRIRSASSARTAQISVVK